MGEARYMSILSIQKKSACIIGLHIWRERGQAWSRRLVGVLHKDDEAEAGQLMAGLLDLHELWLALDVQMVILQQTYKHQSASQCT